MTRRWRYVVAGAATLALGALWRLWAVPSLTRLPEDFHYEADIFSRDDLYDAATGRFPGEVLSNTRFSYQVVERHGDALLVRNVFDVRQPTGEKIFAVERLLGVDRATGKLEPGLGDRDREGYLFAPRGAAGRPFTYWHINYDEPARMVFQGEDEILGLPVSRYACDYHSDQSANLSYLPGVPGERGVELDIHLEVWLEPASGWLVKYEDHTTAWYYDARSHRRLHPWNRFRNQYTEASVAEQVRRARHARQRVQWAGSWGWTTWAFVSAGLWLWARRSGGVDAWVVLAALSARPWSLRRRASLAAAVSTALLGAAVMAAWLLRWPQLIQVSPEFAPMQFNTALAFALCGLGLGAARSRRHGLAVAIAAAATVLGALTLAQYLFRVDLGIDQAFLAATITVQTSSPGRMAPMTSVCFSLAGAALLCLSGRRRLAAAAGILGSAVASLGGAALLGYVLQLPQTYRLGPWTSMAIHTAAGFVALGLGLLAEAWPSWESETGPRRLALYAGVGGTCFLLLLYFSLRSREEMQVRRLVTAEAERAAGRMADRMEERVRALRRMARRWQDDGGTPQPSWERDAARYVGDYPGFAAVSWVDSSARVRWIVPRAGNEAVTGLDLSSEENRRRALEEARRSHDAIVSGPLDLAQGGRGFLICSPLFIADGRFDGFITGVFRFDRLMDVLVREIAAQGHSLSLWVDGEEVYRRGPPPAPGREWTATEEIRIAGTTWRLQLMPRPEWADWVRSSLPEVTLTTGLAVLALACLCLALGWKAGRQTVLLQRERDAGIQREAKFRDLLEAAPDAVVVADAEGRVVLVNAQAERMFGFTREELQGQPVEVLVPERFRAQHPVHRRTYFAQPHLRRMGAGIELTAQRKDGSEISVEIGLSPLKTEDGVLAMSVVRDVTERREASAALARQAAALESEHAAALELAREAQEARHKAEAAERTIAESLSEKEILLKEIHHRVKNNLQIVSTLLRLQSTQVTDPAASGALRESEERVLSMAMLHDNLYRSGDLGRVDFKAYLGSLAAELSSVYGANGRRVRVTTEVAVAGVDLNTAVPLGLLTSELIVNALKHAFPGGRSGEVHVRLVPDGPGMALLTVRDDGVGLPEDWRRRASASLGVQIVETLSGQVKGTPEFRHGGAGTEFRLRFPL